MTVKPGAAHDVSGGSTPTPLRETRDEDQQADHQPGVDPRGPRFGAGITAVLLLITIALALTAGPAAPTTLQAPTVLDRLAQPAALLLVIIFVLFVWGAAAGIRRHPYGILFAKLVRPKLSPPEALEPAAPPTFAQGVGAVVVGAGLLLHAFAVPFALPIAAAAAFLAAFLNAVFGFCLGCEIYLLLRRARVIRA